MRVFGRSPSGAHAKLGLICEELLTQAGSGPPSGGFGPNDRAFAWNLVHDGRVNPDWAEYWYQEYGSPVSPEIGRASCRERV